MVRIDMHVEGAAGEFVLNEVATRKLYRCLCEIFGDNTILTFPGMFLHGQEPLSGRNESDEVIEHGVEA